MGVKMRNKIFNLSILLMISIFALTFLACTGAEDADTETMEESTEIETEKEETADPGSFSTNDIVIDGSIESHEYPFALNDDATGMEVFWLNDTQYIYIGIIASSSGWTAIGFNPEAAMKGANILFMSIDGQDVSIRDDFGTSTFSHSSDEEIGGSFDVEEYAGSSEGDRAVYELKILLNTGDEFDGVLSPGEEYKVIFATNDGSTDFDSKHSKRSSGLMQLDQ
jgi:hypothetical protein